MINILINNFLFTLSTFTSIKTPAIEFNKDNTKYTYQFLPLIGIIIGMLSYLSYILLAHFIDQPFILSLLMIAINIIITGGIHHDGLLDSLDAFKSYRSKEEKKRIIKDSCIGAFSVIYFTIILILFACSQYYVIVNNYAILFLIAPIISRTLLMNLINYNQLAKDDMLETLWHPSLKNTVLFLSIIYAVVTILIFQNVLILIIWFVAILYLVYYNLSFKKHFDFLNGDLCGYFIITCELVCVLGVAIISLVR